MATPGTNCGCVQHVWRCGPSRAVGRLLSPLPGTHLPNSPMTTTTQHLPWALMGVYPGDKVEKIIGKIHFFINLKEFSML